ncbi:hypothetical protein MTX37_28820 [Rhodococcus sp. ARC_M8]|uniref:hypothetical protein n=1 Tax=Rhodococcus sp. ARC_M8 TaxID=2928853 RepID=UPI001FB2A98F|nr:hypothetical protein [Rhodococcus sp. ARC_M8]MCJ0949928.1 hypothetical protein [Rhodococcus sp. ARC_M8]
MAKTRVYLNGLIPGLERHFTGEDLAELTLLVENLRKGRAASARGKSTAEGYMGDATRAAVILTESTEYSYIDVNVSPDFVMANPEPGWNHVHREKETDNPIHNVVSELSQAGDFFTIPELELKTIDVKDYLIGTDVREFFLPDRAVAALELIQA